MFATIEPVSVFPSTATVLWINNANVQPGTSASYQWWLQSAERENLTTGTVNLTGEAYAAWGADDTYLYTFTAQTLGLVIEEIVRDAAAEAARANIRAKYAAMQVAVDAAADAPALVQIVNGLKPQPVAQVAAPVVSDEVPAGGTND